MIVKMKTLFHYLITLGLGLTISIVYADLVPHVFLTSALDWKSIPGMPPGAQVAVIDGNPNSQDAFVVRVKLPPHYHMPIHSHRIDEYYTILSGTYYLDIGDAVNSNNKLTLPAGSFVKIPALLLHSGRTNTESIIQIHGIGPHGLEYNKNQE